MKPHLPASLLLILLFVAACSAHGVTPPPGPAITATTTLTATPAPFGAALAGNPTPTPTSTATLALPAATSTATETATNTPLPTPAALTVVQEENGWVTYRNEIVGYEISAPKGYVIKGGGLSFIVGNKLLGPAVPDEEIYNLVSRYYGDSLNLWIRETGPSGQDQPWAIGIYAYDIIVNDLHGIISPGGVGDYQLTSRQETLQIDWHSYPVKFTIELRDHQPVGELAVLHLEKDGIELMFGYIQPKDDPAAYQTYLKEVWPKIRKIIESYKKLPDKNSPDGNPSVNASGIKDASPQAIAQALFEQYLMAFQENLLDPQMKLSAYRIDEVEIPARWQACAELNNAKFIASITYSVKPERWPSEKWADDGYLTFDQWITRKKASIAVLRSDQYYTMKILDNPVCPGF